MRYAIVSDIHANIRAWDAVLADIRVQGADAIICLGDVVGYGPNPAEVLKAVRAETSHFVLGNHDAAAAGMMDYSIFNDHARQAIEWTMTELDEEATRFLASVPLAIEADEILFVHAEAVEPGHFGYIDGVEEARENFVGNEHFVTFVGHTHNPKIFECGNEGEVRELGDETCTLDAANRYIVNVGSVGEPRNPDDLRARYVIYDSEKREVDFRRVEFDIVAYRAELEKTDLALRPYFLQVYEQVVEGKEEVVSSGESLVDMQVSQGSASLVDLGQVSNVVNMELASAKPSRAPAVILGVVAALVLGVLGVWALKSGGKDSEEKSEGASVIVAKDEVEEVQEEPKEEVAEEIEKPKAAMAEVELPAAPVVKEEVPESEEKVVEAEVEAKEEEIPRITWRMDEVGEFLEDETGGIKLTALAAGRKIGAIAPNPVPETQEENGGALQLGIWQEEEPGEVFGLRADESFTFEGWFLTQKFRRAVFLLGTRTGEEDKTGWHLDLRPPRDEEESGKMSFYYQSGGKPSQALAEAVKVDDLKPHHFAVVWDHDFSNEGGEMRLYLDGAEVAKTRLRHADILGKQMNPFRIGKKGNPRRLAMDELRLSGEALEPKEFLSKAPILGVKMVKADEANRDNWGVAENWEGGKIPSGDDNIIIEEGVEANAGKSTPHPNMGLLVLKKRATLDLWEDECLVVIPKSPSRIVMYRGAQLVFRTGNCKIGLVELKGDAVIGGGGTAPKMGHGAQRIFEGEITGPGKLTVDGVNSNQIRFTAANSFEGGFRAYSSRGHAFIVYGVADQAFGTGDVKIDGNCSLVIGANIDDVIDDGAILRLGGRGVLKVNKGNAVYKLLLRSDETVAGFFINGKDQGEGVFSNKTHKVIGGGGKLTVKRPAK